MTEREYRLLTEKIDKAKKLYQAIHEYRNIEICEYHDIYYACIYKKKLGEYYSSSPSLQKLQREINNLENKLMNEYEAELDREHIYELNEEGEK